MPQHPADIPALHHFVALPGARLHVVEVGPRDGAPVVLLHGFPNTWWLWREQLLPLSRAGFRLFAVDLRGHGESSLDGPYDIDTVAGDVAHLVEALGLSSAAVVGHDWGGAVAWHVAASTPHLVRKLAVLNCPPVAVLREKLLTAPSLEQLQRSWYIFLFQLPWLPEWLLTRDGASLLVRMHRSASVDKESVSAESLGPEREALLRPGVAGAMLGYYRAAFWRGLKPGGTPRRVVHTDTLLLWGTADPALSHQVLVPAIRELTPSLEVQLIEGVGHWLPLEKPAVVNAHLVRFLR